MSVRKPASSRAATRTFTCSSKEPLHGLARRSTRFAFSASLFILALAGVEQVTGAPSSSHPDFDVRASHAFSMTPTADQLAWLEALPDLTVRWNETWGVPELLIRYGDYLTGPNADPKDFLRSIARLLGLSSEDLANLILVKDYTTQHNGARHVVFNQLDKGRVVHGSLIKLTLDNAGRIVIMGGTYFPGTSVEGAPRLDAARAVEAAADSVDTSPVRPFLTLDREQGPSHRTRFENSLATRLKEPNAITAELVTFPMPAGEPARLGWEILLEADSGWYETVVDADTGELLYRHSYAAHASPEGNVFVVQNPNLGSQQVVPFVGASFNNSGWVTDRTTAGNNANAYVDLDNDDSPDYQPQTPPAGDPDYQHFNYTFTDAYVTSGGIDITTDRDAAVTQAFYWVNWLHDYFYALGFDEAAENFQDDNFGRGGLGNDGMLVEVHNDFANVQPCTSPPSPVPCPEGSNTQSPKDGSRPRMELNAAIVDGAMDADLITHEYTHGVSNRLVCGEGMPNRVQTWALGEGWSDFFATSIWDDPIAGEYVCGDPSGCPLYAYDNTPLVYSDLCTLVPGCEPHRDGEIWTAPLWDLRAALIDRYGSGPGKDLTEQLVVDGMKMTPCPANFLEARDALLAADMVNNNGDHQCLLWAVFAGREMGVNASTSTDQKTVSIDTSVPASCTPTADTGGPYTTPEGTNEVINGAASSPGTDPSVGSIALYEWDLDNDGQYDDATGSSAVFDMVGQDGTFTVGLRVTNSAGASASDTTTVTVTNVTPTVQLDPITPSVEGTTITLTGVVSDPGWLDGLTGVVDWDDGNGPQSLPGVLENMRPDATLTIARNHTYGDNGAYAVNVCAADDDSTSCGGVSAVVANAVPTAAIVPSGQSTYDGVSAYIVDAGAPVAVAVRSTDPGSDDLTLTWDWQDGTSSVAVSLVNPPTPDPAKSPSVQPRDVTLSRSHAYAAACFYELEFSSQDDDGGSASDTAAVIIVGNATRTRGTGWWMNQYRPKPPNDFSPETLQCYLDITVFLSSVFNSPIDSVDAVDILHVRKNRGTAEELFDEQLLAAWLNFANGAIALADLVDTDGDGSNDAAFGAAVLIAEDVRNNPASTRGQLLEQKDILERIVLRDD